MPIHEANGTPIHYIDQGKGTPLVLLHGFPFDSRMWAAQLTEFAATHRVILPDFPGFGQSKSDKLFTINSMADDIRSLLAAAGALPCVLGGWSMGGYVALAFARKFPGDLAALMLLDTKAEPDAPEAKEQRQKMIDLARSSGAKAVTDQMLPKLVAPHAADRRPELERSLREIMESVPAKTLEHALSALRDRPDATGVLPTIKVPTLVVVGDGDSITQPAGAEKIHKVVVGSKYVVIRGAGHMSPMEQPAQFNQAVRRFL